jgi:hypothetical protein
MKSSWQGFAEGAFGSLTVALISNLGCLLPYETHLPMFVLANQMTVCSEIVIVNFDGQQQTATTAHIVVIGQAMKPSRLMDARSITAHWIC